MKWETEQGEVLELSEMGFGHLENSYHMVERRIEAIDALLAELDVPTPAGTSLTDDAAAEVYVLKSTRLKLQDILAEFQQEIARRRVELEPGFKLFFSSPLWPKK